MSRRSPRKPGAPVAPRRPPVRKKPWDVSPEGIDIQLSEENVKTFSEKFWAFPSAGSGRTPPPRTRRGGREGEQEFGEVGVQLGEVGSREEEEEAQPGGAAGQLVPKRGCGCGQGRGEGPAAFSARERGSERVALRGLFQGVEEMDEGLGNEGFGRGGGNLEREPRPSKSSRDSFNNISRAALHAGGRGQSDAGPPGYDQWSGTNSKTASQKQMALNNRNNSSDADNGSDYPSKEKQKQTPRAAGAQTSPTKPAKPRPMQTTQPKGKEYYRRHTRPPRERTVAVAALEPTTPPTFPLTSATPLRTSKPSTRDSESPGEATGVEIPSLQLPAGDADGPEEERGAAGHQDLSSPIPTPLPLLLPPLYGTFHLSLSIPTPTPIPLLPSHSLSLSSPTLSHSLLPSPTPSPPLYREHFLSPSPIPTPLPLLPPSLPPYIGTFHLSLSHSLPPSPTPTPSLPLLPLSLYQNIHVKIQRIHFLIPSPGFESLHEFEVKINPSLTTSVWKCIF
ncbi:hypothetical protein C7M84_004976 [Penaeus vannamei]|uniref:Uncharacterized protein n=1 Tax=Penaeus vannamei TaxID=6689 RepID=A0A423TJ11_PENVA|nr:hypothetical protein C7M84_004976 [Penaeus vannamei]